MPPQLAEETNMLLPVEAVAPLVVPFLAALAIWLLLDWVRHRR